MSLSDYYILIDRVPRVATYEEYGEWVKRPFDETRRVAKDKVGDIEVSTVFLTIDHGYDDGAPVLFETMIFGGDHDENQWRYRTWDEAIAGHVRVVADLIAGVTP